MIMKMYLWVWLGNELLLAAQFPSLIKEEQAEHSYSMWIPSGLQISLLTALTWRVKRVHTD